MLDAGASRSNMDEEYMIPQNFKMDEAENMDVGVWGHNYQATNQI